MKRARCIPSFTQYTLGFIDGVAQWEMLNIIKLADTLALEGQLRLLDQPVGKLQRQPRGRQCSGVGSDSKRLGGGGVKML